MQKLKSLRETFLPDEGEIFVKADLCLTGDTKIATLLGDKEIKEATIGDKVFSFHDNRVTHGEITAKQLTKKQQIYEVEIDSGAIIRGTGEHRFMVVRYWGGKHHEKPVVIEEICLKDLKPKDRLVPLRKTFQLGYEILYSRSSFEWTKTHQLVAEAFHGERPSGFDVHHINGDKLNNCPDNLRYVEKRKHNKKHAKESFAKVDQRLRIKKLRRAIKRRDFNGDKNPMYGVRRSGKDNPNYGNRKGKTIKCLACGKAFYVKPSLVEKKKYCCWGCFQNDLHGLNHKVVSVKIIGTQEDVYSITVEPHHNYALSCGVFVKNSQVEDRMGKMYCGSERMVHLANLPPWEYDCHTENASAIFGEDITKLDKDDFKRKRYLGKKVVHASWRQMAGHKMSESVSKDTDGEVFIPPKECQRLIERYLEKNPEICDTYFPRCRAQVQNGGICFNSWGRRFDVRHLRIDADLYRKVFSFFPQSECLSSDTEVLTRDGWIEINSWNGQAIMCFDKGRLFFDVPKNYIIKNYSGDLLHFKGTRCSQKVTPNHRMLYVTNKVAKVKTAEELFSYSRPQLINAGYHKDGYHSLNKNWITLIAAIQADSTIKNNSLEWHFKKKRKIVRLCRTLEKLNIKYGHNKFKDGSYGIWTLLSRVPQTILNYVKDKKYSSTLLNLCPTTKKLFLLELKHWDGSKPKSNPNSFWYDSTIKQNSDWVQTIAVLCGYRATQKMIPKQKEHHNDLHRVYISEQKMSIPSKFKRVPYIGKVYCFTTNSGFFLIRHEGKVSVTGNCADWTNQYAVIPAHYYMMAKYGKPASMQIHDEIVVSVPFNGAYDFAVFIKQSVERVREIPAGSGRFLKVPTEVTVSDTLYGGVEFEQIPERREFEERVRGGLKC